MSKVALIMGSLRRPGNGIGIASWLTPLLRQGFGASNSKLGVNGSVIVPPVDVVFVDSTKPPLPLGPITDGSHVPADVRDPTKHPNPVVREWATFVSSCSGFVVLSPEYNGTYSGEFKNTFDHLYWEWHKKPVMLVTYGSQGGTRVAAQLRTLLGGPFKMKVAEKGISIKWPKGSETVPADGEPPSWLRRYEPDVLEAVEEMKSLLAKKEPS